MLSHHSRPELAETFYNSVFCRLFERKYYDNDKIFIVSQVDRRELAERYRVYMSFQVADGGLENSFWEILSSFYFNLPYEDIQRDSRRLAEALIERAEFDGVPHDLRFDLLESLPCRTADLLKEGIVSVQPGEDRLCDLLWKRLHHFVARMIGVAVLS